MYWLKIAGFVVICVLPWVLVVLAPFAEWRERRRLRRMLEMERLERERQDEEWERNRPEKERWVEEETHRWREIRRLFDTSSGHPLDPTP